jgi:chaperonin GroES|uniref:Co-chaperonin GroES n=1 Tax=uncultured virus TaxID=340016 RepID=A0A221S2D8_9VIRU|nr:co-chaperonin GroES [uncultured virus]|tara:strand:- start:679 stop:1050 length:372 start_codon:yes stop_codon:yes gene_type:complete
MYSAEKIKLDEDTTRKLPEPQGYKLLIAIPKLEEKTSGGVIIPDKLKGMEQTASIIGLVIAMGKAAYKDADKFPDGPYCKEGDFVIFRSYSGTRFKLRGEEFRLINDDTVEAVVDDPREYTRV